MEIIPAIDIINGKCVRLTGGDFNLQTIYNEKPLEVAKQFEDAGLRRLHLVDLDGARTGSIKNWKVLESLTSKTSMAIDFGGGIKTEKDVSVVFNSGAVLATVGSIAVKNEAMLLEWFQKFGAKNFLLGADVRDEKIVIAGWLESTPIQVGDFIDKYIKAGVTQVFCTDVGKDGKLEGPAISLFQGILERFPHLHFIASGGVSSIEDLDSLQRLGCKGVIIGKAIYENRIKLKDLKAFMV